MLNPKEGGIREVKEEYGDDRGCPTKYTFHRFSLELLVGYGYDVREGMLKMKGGRREGECV